MAKTFREALLAHAERRGLSLAKVAEGADVSYEQLKKLRQRVDASTNVDDAIKIANFFGMTLEEFVGDQTVQDRAQIIALYNQLTPRERAILKAAGEVGSDPGPAESPR